ncbi:hypothetical protein GCM10010109_19340 [Actinoplanes campanulatus]|nr:hypothetical protein GCM10010109_19340 [Actinoplanes campanulatus]GID36452.1 hypothetical protein Aca09nite_29580 [Actinoplanes campanulatus]
MTSAGARGATGTKRYHTPGPIGVTVGSSTPGASRPPTRRNRRDGQEQPPDAWQAQPRNHPTRSERGDGQEQLPEAGQVPPQPPTRGERQHMRGYPTDLRPAGAAKAGAGSERGRAGETVLIGTERGNAYRKRSWKRNADLDHKGWGCFPSRSGPATVRPGKPLPPGSNVVKIDCTGTGG